MANLCIRTRKYAGMICPSKKVHIAGDNNTLAFWHNVFVQKGLKWTICPQGGA